MPWSNSWSGSGGIVADSVEVVNRGQVVASINGDGNINGQTISANTDILLAGDSLKSLLAALPAGVVNLGLFTCPVFSNFTAETRIGGINVVLEANREYQVKVIGLAWTNATNAIGNGAYILLRDENNNLITEADFLQQGIAGEHGIQWSAMMLTAGEPWNTNGAHTIYLSIAAAGSSISTLGTSVLMELVDLGNQPTNTGFASPGGGGGGKTYKTFQITPYDSQSFQGSGAASNGSGANDQDLMYFGQDPSYAPNGNWRSYAWFDTNSGSPGTLGDMIGISSSDVAYLDVFIYTGWWYETAGGTLYIGHTSALANHTSEPGGTYREVSSNFSGRGQGQWISLLGSGIETAVLNGQFQGVILGPGPSNSFSYYGNAEGQDHPAGLCPQIRGGYYK